MNTSLKDSEANQTQTNKKEETQFESVGTLLNFRE